MLDALVEGVIGVDAGGRVHFMNAAAEGLTGWSREAALGRPIEAVLWLVDEATRRRIEYPVAEHSTLAAPKIEGAGRLLIASNGSEVPVDVRATAVRDAAGGLLGTIVILHDVGELRRAGQTQNRLAAIVDSSNDAIVSKTLEGVVLSWNRGAERIFGYSAADMIGRPITMLFPPDRLGEETDFLARMAKGETIEHYETVRVRKDGTPIDVSVTLSPVRDAGGRVVAVSKIARDITERKRVERERATLLQREQRALEESRSLNRLKDEFVATLSHELRTPINAIVGWAHLLASGRLSPADAARAVDVIVRNAGIQTQLINDLMDLSAVAVGKMRVDIQRTDLVLIVGAAVESIRPSAATKRLTVEVVPASGPIELLADPGRLQQVVWNLLTNSLKFTGEGGRIEVRVERDGDLARVVVSDTGVGIAPDVLPAIFERFQQADASTTRRHGGLGLGLAISRHLVELHGGSIWAESEGLGRGARFTFELGLLRGHAHDIPALAPRVSDADQDDGELAGLRILVVDDDESSRRLVGEVLSLAGATVVEVGSAVAALRAARRERFDIVVSDVAMPDTDGYSLARALRREMHPALRVALTAFATDDDRDRARQAGFHAHVAKPVLPHDLVREILGVVRGSRTA
jgi:PAS domain S-box-containing protein